MIIRFNEAQLERAQRESLESVLGVLQAENENELEVTVVEFPEKLMVKLDNDIGMVLGWDAEKQSYAGLTTPEPEPNPSILKGESLTDDKSAIQDEIPEPKPKTFGYLDMAGKFTPAESELDLSPIVERVEALARAFVRLAKPCDTDRRIELMIRFCSILYKEL